MNKVKIFKNISWLFIDKIIRISGGLLVGIWVARYLGPDKFGILNYAIAYVAFFTLFVKLGLNQIVVREIKRKPEFSVYILGSAFVLKLIGSLLAVLFVLFSLNIVNLNFLTKSIIFILSLGFVFQSFEVIDYYYQSKMLSKYVVIARNIAFIISNSIKVFLIINKYDVLYFAIVIVFEMILYAILLIVFYIKTDYNIKKWKFNKKISLKLLKYSWPLALSSFLIFIHTKVDQIMIGNMINTREVGIYSVAVRLSEFWMFVPTILVSTLLPYFVELKERNKKSYYSKLMMFYSFVFWLGVIVGLLSVLYGKEVISFLFGKEYVLAYYALVINIWTGLFVSQAVARGIWMLNENLQHYRLYNNILAVITNLSLNYILIPKFGISGAAFATLITQMLGTWFFPLLWKPLRESTVDLIKSINPYYLMFYFRRNE